MIGCIGTVVTNYAKIDMYRSIGVYTSGQYLVATNHPKKNNNGNLNPPLWGSVTWERLNFIDCQSLEIFTIYQKLVGGFNSTYFKNISQIGSFPQGFGVKIPRIFETRKWVPRKGWCKRLISIPFSKKDQIDQILAFRGSDPPKSCWIFLGGNVNLQIAPTFFWWRITGCDPVFSQNNPD